MYRINECYKEFITNREAILAGVTPECLTLKFLWKNPDRHIVERMSGEPFFQLFFKNDIMFLLLKFTGLKWVDIPCIFGKSAKSLFHAEFKNFPVKVILINSNTGKVFLNNTYKMPEGVTKAFIQEIHLQKDMPEKITIEKINNIRASFSATEMARLSLGSTV